MKILDVKGTAVPALGFGTWQLTGRDCERAVGQALDIGYRHIDTARAYGNEAEVGAAIRASGVDREEIFLTTKVWMDDLAGGRLQRAVADSLHKLGLGYIDLVLVHWPSDAVPLGETLIALANVRHEGLTRHIGVSNFTVRLLREAVEVHDADLLCNQVEYHPLLSQEAVHGYLRRHGMMLTAYAPLARGETGRHPTITGIARKYGKSGAQVTLRWLIQQELVAAIPKAASEKHARANFDIFDFTLSDEEMAAIDALRGGKRFIDPSWAPAWDPA